MGKRNQWQKPELKVLERNKRRETAGQQSCLGPAPAQYYFGPAPAPFYLGPAPAPDYFGPAPAPPYFESNETWRT